MAYRGRAGRPCRPRKHWDGDLAGVAATASPRSKKPWPRLPDEVLQRADERALLPQSGRNRFPRSTVGTGCGSKLGVR